MGSLECAEVLFGLARINRLDKRSYDPRDSVTGPSCAGARRLPVCSIWQKIQADRWPSASSISSSTTSRTITIPEPGRRPILGLFDDRLSYLTLYSFAASSLISSPIPGCSLKVTQPFTGLGGSLKITLAAIQFGTRTSALHPLGTAASK